VATLADVWSGAERRVVADAVVPVLARRSREDLFLELAGEARAHKIRLERVGDCVSPKLMLIQNAIADAYELARVL
jgi:hypothetical protein